MSEPIPFLKQVAQVYIKEECENLIDYCFVFPNKRSATFFGSFISELAPGQLIEPATTTISDFVASLSPYVEANRYEQLFTLYNEYINLPDVDIDFDRFLFWGEMLISDFNDVDRYLVNPEKLFVNVKKLREISSNYLTPEQIEIIEQFWGEQSPHQHVERFWNHIDYGDDTDSRNRSKFIRLWEVLYPLYISFYKKLAERGLTTNGMLYRNAAERLKKNGTEGLPFTRYIFVGFNVLSASEISIFSSLRRYGAADYYWDCNSPALRLLDNRARRFISRNIEAFPSLYELEEDEIDRLPSINILGIPSAIGQVKAAGKQLTEWADNGVISNCNNAIDTAIVLPDESLFIPLIHSVPEKFSTMNVTMGFPMRLSPVASLMRSIISLQLRMRLASGTPSFFFDDVKPLLSAPMIIKGDPDGVKKLSEEVTKRRLYQIPVSLIKETAPGVADLFQPIGSGATLTQIRDYIDCLCDYIESVTEKSDKITRHFVESYRDAVKKLCRAASDFGISISGNALFQLVERSVNSDTLTFVGEPLAGLQIMGVLETRALDFSNLIMLSMNERVFPRKHYTRSFIPDALRRGYGMATLDFQESIFAYYFYRLISRAKNVTLIYDARRVGGARSNEMSRYLAQLLYIFGNENIKHFIGLYPAKHFEAEKISVTKTERILKLLKRFTPEGGDKNLSASAINTYLSCPLNFYLQYVEGLSVDDEITDYMDFSTLGTIVHDVMENIYKGFQPEGTDGNKLPVTVTEEMLSSIIDSKTDAALDKLITATVNREFNQLKEEKALTPLTGEALILSRIFKRAIKEMLTIDRTLTPFTFVAAEYSMRGTLRINENLTVNVRQIIDRIDIVDNRMRFVDYKTGKDKTKAASVEALFDSDRPDWPKAIMQLMLYCHIYRVLENDDQPITPVIYKMQTIMSNGVEAISVGSRKEAFTLDDYHLIYDDYRNLLNMKIAEIFDPEIPFVQAEHDKACKFCQFKSICGREDC